MNCLKINASIQIRQWMKTRKIAQEADFLEGQSRSAHGGIVAMLPARP
jgi:hypothetical protein